MLRACRRVLRRGGRIAFTVIEQAPGLRGRPRKAVADAGPRGVAPRRPYPQLLATAGFGDVGARDVTAAYLDTIRAWQRHYRQHRAELAAIDGEDRVAERLAIWRGAIAVIEPGWLRRTVYWATRPDRT